MQKPLRCDQNWLEMEKAPGGRICAKCTKKIHDFRGMSWKEIEELQSQNNNSLCGIYKEKQLKNWGAEVPDQSPLNKAAVWGAVGLLGIGATSTKASAQQEEVVIQSTQYKLDLPGDSIAQKDSTEYIEIYGQIKIKTLADSTLIPAEGAIIDILHLTVVTTTDANGEFRLKVPKDSLYIERKLRASLTPHIPALTTIPAFLDEGIQVEMNLQERKSLGVITYSVATPTTYQKAKWRFRNLFRRKNKKR